MVWIIIPQICNSLPIKTIGGYSSLPDGELRILNIMCLENHFNYYRLLKN